MNERPGRLRLALRALTSNVHYATDGRDVLLNSPDGWEVEQPWLWWTGPGNGSLGPFGHPIPGSLGAGYTGIPAVDRATRYIVDMLAVLPWHVYRDETERLPTPEWIADPQARRVDGRVVDPAGLNETRMSRVDFWAQWLVSALWFGDGFVYVPARDNFGAPKPPLWVLNPYDVEVRDGRYWVANTELPAGSIIHLRRGPVTDGRGIGVLDQFTAELSAASAQREYVAGAFTAGVPAGYLKTTTPNINQEQADALKTRWLSQHGTTRRSIAVLNATTEFHPLTWSPVDLAAVDFARVTLNQVALMFGVPAYLLGGATDSMTYANVESRMLELYQLTWLPWCGRIESVLDAELPRGTEMKIVLDGVLRADSKTRAETYKLALESGWLTVDEVRALEDRPPLVTEAGVL